jgi:hypothetical protein
VIEIFEQKKNGQESRLGAAIARTYGVTPKAVRDIWKRRTWADITSVCLLRRNRDCQTNFESEKFKARKRAKNFTTAENPKEDAVQDVPGWQHAHSNGNRSTVKIETSMLRLDIPVCATRKFRKASGESQTVHSILDMSGASQARDSACNFEQGGQNNMPHQLRIDDGLRLRQHALAHVSSPISHRRISPQYAPDKTPRLRARTIEACEREQRNYRIFSRETFLE